MTRLNLCNFLVFFTKVLETLNELVTHSYNTNLLLYRFCDANYITNMDVYDTIHERKREPNIKSQTAPVQIKPRIIVFLERNEVCAGDSPQRETTLKVEDFDDFIYNLKHHYLPVVVGDVRWFAHLYSLNGPVIFRLDIPLVGECKVYDVAPDSWLADGVSIYMEYDS